LIFSVMAGLLCRALAAPLLGACHEHLNQQLANVFLDAFAQDVPPRTLRERTKQFDLLELYPSVSGWHGLLLSIEKALYLIVAMQMKETSLREEVAVVQLMHATKREAHLPVTFARSALHQASTPASQAPVGEARWE
jgi:hypothetical protein